MRPLLAYRIFNAALAVALFLSVPSTAASAAIPTVSIQHGASMVKPTHGTWVWPVIGDRAVVRSFEAPATRYSAGHRGIDLATALNTAVVAPSNGVVSFVGTVVDRPVLSITSGGGLVSSIEPVIATVQSGDVVAAGEVVGAVSSGGHCGTTCAHFGVRLYGEYVNPLVLLESLPRAVLLPIGR